MKASQRAEFRDYPALTQMIWDALWLTLKPFLAISAPYWSDRRLDTHSEAGSDPNSPNKLIRRWPERGHSVGESYEVAFFELRFDFFSAGDGRAAADTLISSVSPSASSHISAAIRK